MIIFDAVAPLSKVGSMHSKTLHVLVGLALPAAVALGGCGRSGFASHPVADAHGDGPAGGTGGNGSAGTGDGVGGTGIGAGGNCEPSGAIGGDSGLGAGETGTDAPMGLGGMETADATDAGGMTGEDSGLDSPAECPAQRPSWGDSCTGQLYCTYGQLLCCGQTVPASTCSCQNGSFGCISPRLCNLFCPRDGGATLEAAIDRGT
jgi:hypothetical protein